MRYLLPAVVFICLCSVASYAQTALATKALGWCEDGNYTVAVSGINSTTRVQRSFPSCTVTVYVGGTTTLASIFADTAGTVKANPFTAATSGQWFFFANTGFYDIRFSGGGITAPFTLFNNQVGAPQTTVDCSRFPGTTGGAKIAGCLSALPATGGVADATNILGPQTISQDIFAGVPVTKPVTLLLGAATYTVTATQNISSNKSTVRCQGTTLVQQTGPNFSLFNISATDDIVEDCLITAQPVLGGAGVFTYVMTFLGSNRALVRHNTVTNLTGFCFYITNATNLRIVNNSVFGISGTNSAPTGIETSGGGGNVNNLWIEGNRIDVPGGVSSGEPMQIAIGNITTAADVGRVTVINNILSTGNGFCGEYGPFDSNPNNTVHDVTITGNSCTLTAGGMNVYGGFSSGGGSATTPVSNIVMSGNVVDAAGFQATIAAFEVSSVHGFAVTGNTVRNGSGLASCVLSGGFGENGTISGNSCSFAPTGIGIDIITASPDCCKQKLSISNNTIEFSPGGSSAGINVQCNNAAAAICRDISITGNAIFGDGTANSVGIGVTNNAGVVNNISISGNSIYKTSLGIQFTGTEGVSVTNNSYDAGNSTGSGIWGSFNPNSNFNISNNVIISTTPAGVLANTLNFGISMQGLSVNGVISNNQISGINNASGATGITVNSLNSTTTQEKITITGNSIDVTAGATGIYINCNQPTAICQDFLIEGNHLFGNSTGTAAGIIITTGGGALQRITISNNKIQNFFGCVNLGSNFVGKVMNNTFDCTGALFFNVGPVGMTFVDFNGTPIGNLPNNFANGSMIYVTDATIANPCAGGGTGAILKRLNGVNVCN